MRIAVDAMGGDHAPHEIVKGAVESAARIKGITRIILAASVILILSGAPIIPVASAADCASASSATTCSG